MKLTFTPTPERASSESRTANGNARLVWGLINPKKGSSPAKQDHEIALVALSEEKDTEVLRLPSGAKVINIGAGKKKEMTRRKFILLLRKVVATAKANKIARMEIPFGAFLKFSKNPANATDVAELMACQFTLADFEFDKYKTEGAEERAKAKLAEVIISGNLSPKVKKAFERGTKIGEEINACRMLANTPAEDACFRRGTGGKKSADTRYGARREGNQEARHGRHTWRVAGVFRRTALYRDGIYERKKKRTPCGACRERRYF